MSWAPLLSSLSFYPAAVLRPVNRKPAARVIGATRLFCRSQFEPSPRLEKLMKKLIAVLIAEMAAGITFSAMAADEAAPDDKPAMEKKHKAKKHHKKAAKKEEAAPAPAPAK